MRALQVEAFGDPKALRVSDLPERTPTSSEIKLRMGGVGIGFFDGLLVKGEYQIKPPLPFVPGSSIAGVVEEVGEGVTHLKVGDHVAGFAFMGGLAEKITLNALSCFAIPKSIPLLDAANFFIAYATGLYGLRECGRLQPGETVLVLGASDRKSTRLNSSHSQISYAVFCFKKKKSARFAGGVGATTWSRVFVTALGEPP